MDRGEVSFAAKQDALAAWVRQYQSVAVAAEQAQLPQSLRGTILGSPGDRDRV